MRVINALTARAAAARLISALLRVEIIGENLGRRAEDLRAVAVAGRACHSAVWVNASFITCVVTDISQQSGSWPAPADVYLKLVTDLLAHIVFNC